MTDFEALLRSFDTGRVEYIAVGGAAALAHGSARFSQDLDVVCSHSAANLEWLAAALRDLKPYLRSAPPRPPFCPGPRNAVAWSELYLGNSPWIHRLVGRDSGGRNLPGSRGCERGIASLCRTAKCPSLEQLIWAKRAAGRPKDLEALAELEALREEALNG